MAMTIQCNGLDDLSRVAEQIIDFGQTHNVWLFMGQMGAGKTTLIGKIVKEMGYEDDASSPSFSIVNEYQDKNGNPIYHFDFYRIKNEQEAIDIGLDEYLYSGYTCMIEWPSKIESLWPDSYLTIDIEMGENLNERRIILSKNDR